MIERIKAFLRGFSIVFIILMLIGIVGCVLHGGRYAGEVLRIWSVFCLVLSIIAGFSELDFVKRKNNYISTHDYYRERYQNPDNITDNIGTLLFSIVNPKRNSKKCIIQIYRDFNGRKVLVDHQNEVYAPIFDCNLTFFSVEMETDHYHYKPAEEIYMSMPVGNMRIGKVATIEKAHYESSSRKSGTGFACFKYHDEMKGDIEAPFVQIEFCDELFQEAKQKFGSLVNGNNSLLILNNSMEDFSMMIRRSAVDKYKKNNNIYDAMTEMSRATAYRCLPMASCRDFTDWLNMLLD